MPASSYYRRIIGANERLNVVIAGLGRRLGACYEPIALKESNVQLMYLFMIGVNPRLSGNIVY